MASALVVAACLVAAWSLGAWRGTSTMAAADVDAPPIKGIATDPDAESARSVRLSESRGRVITFKEIGGLHAVGNNRAMR